MSKIEFTGTPSGDCESFCWEVDYDTFVRLKNTIPQKYDKAIDFDKTDGIFVYKNNAYKIYPDDFFKDKRGQKITIIIENE